LGLISLPVVVARSLTKVMQTEQLLCWSGMTDTEHTTSDSNKVDQCLQPYMHVVLLQRHIILLFSFFFLVKFFQPCLLLKICFHFVLYNK